MLVYIVYFEGNGGTEIVGTYKLRDDAMNAAFNNITLLGLDKLICDTHDEGFSGYNNSAGSELENNEWYCGIVESELK